MKHYYLFFIIYYYSCSAQVQIFDNHSFYLQKYIQFGTEICTPGELFLRGTGDPYPGCLGDNDGVRLDSGELGERLRDLD